MIKHFDQFKANFIALVRNKKQNNNEFTQKEKFYMKLIIDIQSTMDKTPASGSDQLKLIKMMNRLQTSIISDDICKKIDDHLKTNPCEKSYIIDVHPYLFNEDLYKFPQLNKTDIVKALVPTLRAELKKKQYYNYVSNNNFMSTVIIFSSDPFLESKLKNLVTEVEILSKKNLPIISFKIEK